MDYHYLIKNKPSYYSIDYGHKYYLEKMLEPIQQICATANSIGGKESREINKIVDTLLKDEKFVNLIKKYYVDKQIGIKSFCKLLGSKISYSSLRGIINKLGILNTNHKFSDEQRKMRSYNAKNKITPNYPSVYTSPHLMYNNNKQGIQGYYFSKLHNKNIWIRSTYEYIVIDYLECANIHYEYEKKEYVLKDGRKYRPDFHILNLDGSIDKIIEIKSDYYLSHQDDKAFLLKEDFNNVYVIFNVEGICEFFKIEKHPKKLYKEKLKEWKLIRRTKDEIE